MKKNIVLGTAILAISATMVLFSSCQKPSERPSQIDSKVASDIFAIKDLSEITSDSSKTVYYSGSEKTVDKSLTQKKIEGKVQDLLNKVTGDNTKKMLDDQLKTGDIAIVILDDQIKVLKVVPETTSTFDMTLTSMAYLTKLKALVKTTDAKTQASLVSELESIKDKSPAQLGETFGLSEITAIKIKTHGALDNERTEYNEKKSKLSVIERPFEVSTHVLVDGEVGASSSASATKTAEVTAQ